VAYGEDHFTRQRVGAGECEVPGGRPGGPEVLAS
jgi:hypothetical protein